MALSSTAKRDRSNSYADLVLQNGAIYTVNSLKPWASALGIRDRTIVFVGGEEDVSEWIGPKTEVIDLKGKTVLPGFVDSHAHISAAVFMVAQADLHGLPTLDAYKVAIYQFFQKNPELEVIYGSGWADGLFPSTGPLKGDLDAVVPDKPVSVRSYDGHSVWANSPALSLAGITKDTQDPLGGVIERDQNSGEPSGTLRETAMDLIQSALPPFTIEQLKAGIMAYQKMAAEAGITTSHDAMLVIPGTTGSYLGSGPARNNTTAFSELMEAGKLTVHVRGSFLITPEGGFDQVRVLKEESLKHKHLSFKARSAKIFVDGVIEGGTGYLLEPYVHKPDYLGECLWEQDALNEVCAALDHEGIQIHVHAIGDAATRMTLDSLEYARERNGPRDSRHLITHIHLVHPDDIPRFGELGIVGVPQPFWFGKGEYYEKLALPYLGKERADRQYPMKSLVDEGVILASASDFPVTYPCPPLLGIMTGITRSESGVEDPEQVLWPEESLTLEEMIASFTYNGAYANFLEDQLGSIEVGKLADLVVLDQDLFGLPVREIGDTKVLMTLFEGQEVFLDGLI